jgi:phage replication O-like protein O
MALPQLEDGYLRIANELYDAILRHPFSKREQKIIYAIIRKTYGFGKKEDDLTVTQLAELTGLGRSHASEGLDALVSKNTVLKRDGRHGYLLKLNKNYREWGRPKTGHRPKTGRGASQNRTEGRPETGSTKDNYQKTTPKDKERGAAAAQPSLPLANGLLGTAGELIAHMNTKYRRRYQVTRRDGTPTKTAELCMALLKHGYTPVEIRQVTINRWYHWHDDDVMAKNLRPSTVWRLSNFDVYLGELNYEDS